MKKDISIPIDKVDNEEKISGQAKYVDDIAFEGMLYARTVRSTKAHARIRNIHIPYLPEGYQVVDHKDIPGKNYVRMIFADWPVFSAGIVRHIGEPIMLVVGPDPTTLSNILAAITITYEELEPVFAFQNSEYNRSFVKGDPEDAFKRAKKTISYRYETGYQEQAYIEPQGFVGYPEGEKVTLYGSIQCPYYVKNAVTNALGCADDKVRVIQAAVGGAFGGKEEFPSLMACQLAVAIRKVKRPVKLVYEREEDMVVTTKRHPSKTRMEAAIGENDEILALRVHIGLDGGAYMGLSGVVLTRAMLAATSAYTVDHLDVSGDVYITNTVPNGAFRGFGAPQMIFAVEMFINHVAKDLSRDPDAMRRTYLARQGDRTSTSGIFRDPIIMPEMVERATRISDYTKKRATYANEDVYKGIGMSLFLHGCGFTGDGESAHIKARVRLKKDENERVYLLVAAVDMGQGARTTLKKIVQETLEIDPDRVIFDDPDTDYVPDSGPTVASRTVMIVGGLLARAAKEMKDNWVEGPMTVEKVYEQPDYIAWNEEELKGDAYPAYSWGVNVVEVEVSKVTYQVEVKGIWSVYDLGKAIDERIVLGQADGGTAQGVAYGYLEVMRHEKGRIMQKNMTDYIIPTAVDMAPTETHLYENPYAYGPYGAKGFGELTLVGGAPAVALAIEQAISRRVRRIPVTPEYIMELIEHEEN
ncbi:MAG: xanthine dehydrogenase family protein molybdopterin-binding subunit [Acholeplasmataceae bacterium]